MIITGWLVQTFDRGNASRDPPIFPANMQELSACTMYSNFTFSVGTGLFPATVIFIIKYKILSARARIFKHLWSPGIDSKASIPPAYVAWRAGTIVLFLLGA
jgi:hypothetical protein